MKVSKDPIIDMSAANDNVLRPWARNPETDVKLDRAINGLNNILQMTAPQKFSGKQGYSSLDRTPDRIIALYEFARSHPDWVDSFLDGVAVDRPPEGRSGQVLDAMENSLYHEESYNDNYYDSDDGSSVDYSSAGEGPDGDGADGLGDTLVADVDVLQAAFGLSGMADTLGPEFADSFAQKKYLPNGNPRYEQDALRRHSCYERTTHLNKIQKKKEDRRLASVRFLGRYRLTDSGLSMLAPQKQRRRSRRKHKARNGAEVNIMTVNEPEPESLLSSDRAEDLPPRPMTAQEFYDTSLDLLSDSPATGAGDARPMTSSRPATGYLQSGSGMMRAATPKGIPPSPLHACRTATPSGRASAPNPLGPAARPSTAELPLLRPATADRGSVNQSRGGLLSPGPPLAATPSGPRLAERRPATSGSGSARRPSTSSSRYDAGAGGLGGLAVTARPQSRDPKMGLSRGVAQRTMYSDTASQILDSGKPAKYAPFMHQEMSKLRSVRDQMRTMEGRMLAISGNLQAVLDDPNNEYVGEKTTGVSPGGIQFKKKILFPIDAQRKMTERIFREAKEKAGLDQVEPRLKADGYHKVVPPEKLYLSETKKFIVNNDSYDHMRSTMDRAFHIKQGELQEYAEEAQRLGKRPFEVGPGGMKC